MFVDEIFEIHVLTSGPSDDCVVDATMTSNNPTVVSGGGNKIEISPSFSFTALASGVSTIDMSFQGVGVDSNDVPCTLNQADTLVVTVTEPTGSSSANQVSSGIDADPVNTFTGELFDQFAVDIQLGGPMPLFFKRYYASYLRRSFVLGDLGSNWRHNFDAALSWNGTNLRYISNKGRLRRDYNSLALSTAVRQISLHDSEEIAYPLKPVALLTLDRCHWMGETSDAEFC